MEPRLITENFLSLQECQHVYERILHHRSKWFNIKHGSMTIVDGVDPDRHSTYFFGPSQWCLFGDLDRYFTLKSEYNKILWEEFEIFYLRLRGAIESTLNKKTSYSNNVAYPGFHIYGPGLANQSVRYNHFHVHPDPFPDAFHGVIPYGRIFSFIVPIKLPAIGGALSYGFTDLSQTSSYHGIKNYCYLPGSLSYWHGDMLHKIADFDLNGPDDYRLTWQVHVAVNEDCATIFW